MGGSRLKLAPEDAARRAASLPEWRLQNEGSYKPREYIVQYCESDFNFVSRLLEEEGMYYFHEHENGKVKLVIKGTGKILGAGKVEVSGNPSTQIVETKNIVIATGSDIARLKGIDIYEKRIVSSTGALSLESVPGKLLIVPRQLVQGLPDDLELPLDGGSQ